MIAATSIDLIAIVSNPVATSRVVIPLYSDDGNLQSTLTHKMTGTVLSIAFASPQFLCALIASDDDSVTDVNIVVIWNVTRGVVVHTIEKEGVVDIATTTTTEINTATLFCLVQSKKMYIQEYSLEESNKKMKLVRKIKAGKSDDTMAATTAWNVAAFGNDSLCVVNDGSIKILDRESGSKLQKCKLDSSTTTATLLTMNDKYVAACTASQVHVFAMDSAKLITTVAITEPPTQLQLKGDYVLVDLSLYKIGANSGTPSKKKKVAATAMSTLKEENTAMKLFFAAKSDSELQVIQQHKKGGAVEICNVPFLNGDGHVIPQMELPKESDDEPATKKRASTTSVTKTLGPGQAGAELTTVSDRPMKKTKNDDDDDENGPSIADRLKLLKQVLDEEDAEDEEELKSFQPKQATTESLSHLLDQALTSSDDSMLELALNVRDPKVRQLSIDDLPIDAAAVLLNKLTARLAKKPNRASALVPWIQSLLLSGKIQTVGPLLPLRNLVQERLDVFPELLQLEGRLTLLANMQ